MADQDKAIASLTGDKSKLDAIAKALGQGGAEAVQENPAELVTHAKNAIRENEIGKLARDLKVRDPEVLAALLNGNPDVEVDLKTRKFVNAEKAKAAAEAQIKPRASWLVESPVTVAAPAPSAAPQVAAPVVPAARTDIPPTPSPTRVPSAGPPPAAGAQDFFAQWTDGPPPAQRAH